MRPCLRFGNRLRGDPRHRSRTRSLPRMSSAYWRPESGCHHRIRSFSGRVSQRNIRPFAMRNRDTKSAFFGLRTGNSLRPASFQSPEELKYWLLTIPHGAVRPGRTLSTYVLQNDSASDQAPPATFISAGIRGRSGRFARLYGPSTASKIAGKRELCPTGILGCVKRHIRIMQHLFRVRNLIIIRN